MSDPTFDVGLMRHRVTLQRRGDDDPTAGTAGDEDISYTPAGSQWAWVEPLAGRELFNAQQVKATIDYRITMRVVTDVAPQDRLIHDGRVFNIESVIRLFERNEFYQILATQLRGEVP